MSRCFSNLEQRNFIMKILRVFASCSFLLLAISCAPKQPSADKKINDELTSVSYPNKEEKLSLTASEGTGKSYAGTTILWRSDYEHIDDTDFSKVITGKEAVQKLDLKYQKYKKQLQLSKDLLGQYDQTSADWSDHIQQKITQIKEKIEELNNAISNEHSHFENQGLELAQDSYDYLTKGLNSSATKHFEQFCQAAVWELATSKLIYYFGFSKRPSPAGFCESYYQEHNYFTSATCSDADEGVSKNFYACFWGETGVQKTSASYEFLDQDGNSKGAVTGEELLKFKQYLVSSSWGDDFGLIEEFWDFSELLMPKDAAYPYVAVELGGKTLKSVFDSVSFLSGRSDARAAVKDLFKRSRKMDGSEYNSYKVNFNDRLYSLGKVCGFTSAWETDLNKFKLSESDLSILNDMSKDWQRLVGLPYSDVKTESEEVKKYKEILAVYEDQAVRLAELMPETLASMNYDVFQSKLDSQWLALLGQKAKSADHILDTEMAVILWPSTEFQIKRSDDRKVFVSVKLSSRADSNNSRPETLKGVGCYDLEKKQPCEDEAYRLQGDVPLMLDFDDERSYFTLDMPVVSDQKYLEFFPKPANSRPFYQQDVFTYDYFADKSLRWELQLGYFDHELPVVDGKIFIKQGEQTLFEGSVSLSGLL